MKRILVIITCLIATFQAEAQTLRAELAMARFYSPLDGPYLETYLKFKGNSLKLIDSKEGIHSEVVLHYQVLKDGKSVYEDLFKMSGPTIGADSVLQDFIDVQRIPLEKGDYQLVLEMRDSQDPEELTVEVKQAFKMEKPIDFTATIDDSKGGITDAINYFISDIQLVDSYNKSAERGILSKNGMDLIPYTSNFYPETKNDLTIYAEVYNTDTRTNQERKALGNLFKDKQNGHRYLINLFLENAEDGTVVENLGTFLKREASEVIPVFQTFSLATVPSGSYNAVIELRDAENELLERKVMNFSRSKTIQVEYTQPEDLTEEEQLNLTFVGKYNRPEELKEYLRCLHPISNQEEISQVNQNMNFNDANMMKKFMFYFWQKRNPENPESAWSNYWKEVEKVNAAYSTNLKKGYDTDRGRVYLQYGAPNTISPNYFEPNTYPYEIWHYYVLRDHLSADQSNRKFVFAQTEQGTKDFILIHSDAKNEITNIRWNYDLHKRSTATIDLDQEDAGDHFGGHSKEFFETPY